MYTNCSEYWNYIRYDTVFTGRSCKTVKLLHNKMSGNGNVGASTRHLSNCTSL